MSETPRQSIFISYKSEEFPFVAKLRASLLNAGVDVWVDKFEIEPSDHWTQKLNAGLHQSKGLIAILTPDYFKSNICYEELDYAFREKLPIYPILWRPIPKAQKKTVTYPLWLDGRQYLDFSQADDSHYKSQLDKLIPLIQDENAESLKGIPDALTQYLNTLIGSLESWQGVEEYIALAAQAEQKHPDNPPTPPFTKRIDPSFAFLEKAKNKPSADDEQDEKHAIERIPVENIHAALEMHSRFVLIGDPGAGKTTTLRRLALESAYACLDNQKLPIPFMLNLPLWPDETPFDEFLRNQWTLSADILELLRHNKVHLYLDGLNEMGANGKIKAELLKAWLKSKENPSQIIITCRQNDYLTGDLGLDVATVLVEPLDDAAIKAFAEKYLGEGYERFLEKTFAQEKSQRSLLHLARNPYLLSALILVYSAGGELPRNTGALFQQLVYALWERERLRNTPNWIPFEEMQGKLGRLAFAMIDENQPIDVSITYALQKSNRNFLQRLFSRKDIGFLQVAQSANLISVSAGALRFSHQLMLEYFAAVGLREKELTAILKQPRIERYGERSVTKWEEVVIAYAGITKNPDAVIQQVAVIDQYLAAECVGSGVSVTEVVVSQLISQLINTLKNENRDIQNAATIALGKIGKPAIPLLVPILRDKDVYVRSAAVDALGEIADVTAIPYLISTLKDEDAYVRSAAVDALAMMADPALVPHLIIALKDKSEWVRRAAAYALGEMADPALVPHLIIALKDKNGEVRRTAADALGGIADPIAMPHLINILKNKDSRIRLVTTKVLGPVANRITIPFLTPTSSDEDNNSIRRAAAQALGQIANPAAIPALIAALNDKAYIIQYSAAQALRAINTPEALAAVEAWKERRKSTD